MNNKAVFEHWTNWAEAYGAALSATTKTPTVKFLELDAFARHFHSILGEKKANILEVGCGVGINAIPLAKHFPAFTFDGVAAAADSVAAAKKTLAGEEATVQKRVRFFQGEGVALDTIAGLRDTYDLIFTDRYVINVKPLENQQRVIAQMAAKLNPGGTLLMIENSIDTFTQQNSCREVLGLPPRQHADYNLFFEDAVLQAYLPQVGLELTEVEDFISLHDLLLYVLVPATNGGTVDYDHPIVKAGATLTRAISATKPSAFSQFGQNRLYCCRKTGA